MIRKIVDRKFSEELRYVEICGLSTDEKPIEAYVTGSVFIEVDTGNAYFFDEVGQEWNKVGE